jgi:tRNA(fMet)-specific endonuclease VapC
VHGGGSAPVQDWTSLSAAEKYGSICMQLELAGTPIGGNDLIIAAQAVILDLTLVSDNEGDLRVLVDCASGIG